MKKSSARISVSTSSLQITYGDKEALRMAKEAGADGVDFFTNHCSVANEGSIYTKTDEEIIVSSDNVEEMVSNSIISEKLEEKLKQVLTKREYVIICLRYGLNGNPALTQREVANKLKISRSYISRLEKKAIDTIRLSIDKKDYI